MPEAVVGISSLIPVEFKAAQADVVSAKHAKTQAKMHAYADLFMNILLVAAEVNDGMYLSSKKMLNAMNKLKASVIPKVYRPMQDLRAKFIKHWDSRDSRVCFGSERARACSELLRWVHGVQPSDLLQQEVNIGCGRVQRCNQGLCRTHYVEHICPGVCSEGKDLP